MFLRMFVHPLRAAVAGILAASATLAASAPADAATATITLDPVDPGIVVLSASAAPAEILLGFDTTTFPVDTVTFELLFDGFASWPDSCEPAPPSPFNLQVIHCAATELHSVRAIFGPGNDTLHTENVCYDTITANLGDGGNTMFGLADCPTVINVTSGPATTPFTWPPEAGR